MRVLELARFRVQAAASPRVLAAPLLALVALELLGLSGGRQPTAPLMVTAAYLSLPVLTWATRQILDAEPDEQQMLSALAVGGAVRGLLAGLLAAYAVAAPLGVAAAWGSLVLVDDSGVPARVLLAATALALATALAAVAIGAFAARSVAGTGGAAVVVLVAAPVLVAVVGLASSPLVTALVPRLDAAVRATDPPRRSPVGPDAWFVPRAPAVVAQVLLWGLAVLALRLLVARRRTVRA